MVQRLNKEIKFHPCNNIVSKYGTVNRENPQVIYIMGKTWIMPMEWNMDYKKTAAKIRQNFKHKLMDELSNNDLFSNKFILDFNTDRINIGIS